MIDRRTFLRRAAVLTTGVVAADQLDLIERLGWRRRFFAGTSFQLRDQHGRLFTLDKEQGKSQIAGGYFSFTHTNTRYSLTSLGSVTMR